MIKGSYQFASKKVDLANNANLKNYEELFKKTGIKYIYRSTENETSLTLDKLITGNCIKPFLFR